MNRQILKVLINYVHKLISFGGISDFCTWVQNPEKSRTSGALFCANSVL